MTRLSILLAAGVSALAFSPAAQAADLIISEPVPAVGVVDVGGNWDGPFVGGFVGYGWGESECDDGGPCTGTVESLSGWLAGVALGANFTVSDGIVAGIVGDIAWSDLNGEFAPGPSVSIDWSGSLRGRLGFDGGAFMPYLTAGLAVAQGTFEDPGWPITDSNTHIGWTAGAGVEVAVTEDVSLDLLYRYSDYGAQEYDRGFGPADFALTEHRVQAGVNFHF